MIAFVLIISNIRLSVIGRPGLQRQKTRAVFGCRL